MSIVLTNFNKKWAKETEEAENFVTFVKDKEKNTNQINITSMKKLFLAFALAGIVGASAMGTVAAITHSTVIVCGGEKCKHKKCKKGDACSHSKTTTDTNKKCSKKEAKKCCSSTASQSKTCTGKATNSSSVAPAAKPLEVE